MGDTGDVVRIIDIKATTDGVDQAAASTNALAGAMDGVTVASDKTSNASLSVEKSYASLQSRIDLVYRAQQQQVSAQATLDSARSQGLVSDQRYSDMQALIAQRYTDTVAKAGDAGKSASLFGSLIDKGRESLLGFALEGGPVGAFLGSFGPWGVAAAGAIGLITTAMDYFNENAAKFGESSIQINKVSQATGLTTTEVRGLSEAAEKAGVSGDEIGSSFERLTSNLATARDGTGSLFTSLEKVNGQLAVDVASASSGAQAWDLIAKAIAGTSNAFDKAAIAKAAFGKGGAQDIPVLQATFDAGGLAAYSEEVQKTTGITDELTQSTAKLQAQITALAKSTAQIYASIYAQQTLQNNLTLEQTKNQIALNVARAYKEGGAPASVDDLGRPIYADAPAAAAPAAGASTGAASSEQQSAAVKQLTQNTTALVAEQVKATAAQQAYDAESISLTATTGSLAKARMDAGNSLGALSNLEKAHIAALGGAATGAEILQQRTNALTAAYDKGTLSAADYNRAMHGDTLNVVAALQAQIPVLTAIGTAAKMNAQEQATINDLVAKGKSLEDATTIAVQQKANAQAAVSAAFQVQTQAMAEQNAMAALSINLTGIQLLHAQQSLAGQQAYNNAIRDGNTEQDAHNRQLQVEQTYQVKILTTQKQINDAAIQWQQDILGVSAATLQAAQAAQQVADAWDAAQKAISAAANAAGDMTNGALGNFDVPAATGSQTGGVGTGNSFTSTSNEGAAFLTAWFNQSQVVASMQSTSAVVNSVISAGSGFAAAMAAGEANASKQGETFTAPQGPNGPAGSDWSVYGLGSLKDPVTEQDTLSSLTTLNSLQNSGQSSATQLTNDQQFLSWLQTQPETIARDQTIAQLTSSMASLTTSTNAATTATGASTAAITSLPSYLSSLYKSGGNSSVKGFGLADGGIMTAGGAVMGTGGGVVTSPQTFTVGENYLPEAVIPLKGGAVPVSLNGVLQISLASMATSAQPPQNTYNINAPITIVAPSAAGVSQAAAQAAQDFQNMMAGFARR